MLIFCRFDNGLAKGFRRSPPNDVVQPVDVPPALPCCQQARDGVRQTVLVGRNNNTASASGHALHVTQHKGRGDRICLAGSSPRHDNGGIGANQLRQALRGVKVYLFLGLGRHLHLQYFRETVKGVRGRVPQTQHPRCPCFPPGTSSGAHGYAH